MSTIHLRLADAPSDLLVHLAHHGPTSFENLLKVAPAEADHVRAVAAGALRLLVEIGYVRFDGDYYATTAGVRAVRDALAASVGTTEGGDMSGETFWIGEPATAVRGAGVVAPSSFPVFWGRDLIGQRIPVVQVEYGGRRFWLDNRDGSGWAKVTTGHGSPRLGHRNLTVDDFEPAGSGDCWPGHNR